MSNPEQGFAKENPGALAGATGAHSIDRQFTIDFYRNRAKSAMTLGLAIADCHPADACEIMEAALSDLMVGNPLAALFGEMDAATHWADLATQNQAKAYALACYKRMHPSNQAAFRRYILGEVAA